MHLRDFFTDLLTEKAVSKQQQKFFGVVRSMQKGDTPKSGEAGKVAKDMKVSDVKDFAGTKHKGLPKKAVKEEDEVMCDECGGDGIDLDTLYFGSKYDKAGTETDCHVCGGTGYVPKEDTDESINEGDEKRIIHDATVEKLIELFTNKVVEYDTLVDLHQAIYDEMSYLDMEDIGLEDEEDGGQPLIDYFNGRVVDILDSYSVIDDVTAKLDLSELDESLTEEKRFVIFSDGKPMVHFADKSEAEEMISMLKKRGIKSNLEIKMKDMAGGKVSEMFESEDQQEKEAMQMLKYLHNQYVKSGEMNAFELPLLLRQHMPELSKPEVSDYFSKFLDQGLYKEESVSEDKEGDSNEAMVAKMLAKALGDENRWTEMSPYELYSELESERPQDADVIALAAKMLYDIKLKESIRVEEDEVSYDCDDAFFEDFGYLGYSIDENDMFEAEYRGRKVKLNKPMQGDVKKFKVYVKDPKTGNVKKVNFGHGGSSVKGKSMRIRKSNPKARKSFRARHNCDNPGPKTKARYWSCRKW